MTKREHEVRSQLARRIDRWIEENGLTTKIMAYGSGKSTETVRRWRDPNHNSWPTTLDIALIQSVHDCSHFCLSPCCETCRLMKWLPPDVHQSLTLILKKLNRPDPDFDCS